MDARNRTFHYVIKQLKEDYDATISNLLSRNERFIKVRIAENPPHRFDLADRLYQEMFYTCVLNVDTTKPVEAAQRFDEIATALKQFGEDLCTIARAMSQGLARAGIR